MEFPRNSRCSLHSTYTNKLCLRYGNSVLDGRISQLHNWVICRVCPGPKQPAQAQWNVGRIACFIIIIIIGTNCSFIFSFSVRAQILFTYFLLCRLKGCICFPMGWDEMEWLLLLDQIWCWFQGSFLLCVSVSLSMSVYVCRFVYISTNELFTLAINNKIQESTYRSRFICYCLKSRCCRAATRRQ